MAFRMATPYRHRKTGVYWFRKAVPKALQGRIGKTMLQRSLRTKDPAEARRRFTQVAADVEREWGAIAVETAPDRLTHRQRLALAGEFYRWSVERHGDEPGKPSFWEGRIAAAQFAMKPSGRRMPAPGVVVDDELSGFLTERGIRVDDADMWDLTRAAAEAVILAQRTLLRQAEGDYSPSPEAVRFPPYAPPAAPAPGHEPKAGAAGSNRLVLDDHWDAFVTERQLALGTQKRWRPLIAKFAEFLGDKNLAKATPEQVGQWKLALVMPGNLSNKTIAEGHLAALRTFYNWGKQNGKVKFNPVDDIRVAREKVVEDAPSRGRSYRPDQCALILSESLREPDVRMSPMSAKARRWIPWLCAYTGARVNELTQLRRQDVIEASVDGRTVWQIRITPAAGTVKGNKARDVPLHDHLVQQGFIDVVKGSDDGPLFYDPSRTAGTAFNPAYRKVGERLARWIREIGIDDVALDPNHAWRHTFKTSARRVGMREVFYDGIAGHAPRTEGERYGDLPIEVLFQQIRLLPRFEVTPPAGDAPMTEARRRRNEQRVATANRAKKVA